VIGQFLKA